MFIIFCEYLALKNFEESVIGVSYLVKLVRATAFMILISYKRNILDGLLSGGIQEINKRLNARFVLEVKDVDIREINLKTIAIRTKFPKAVSLGWYLVAFIAYMKHCRRLSRFEADSVPRMVVLVSRQSFQLDDMGRIGSVAPDLNS
jgi:hypothetical protein